MLVLKERIIEVFNKSYGILYKSFISMSFPVLLIWISGNNLELGRLGLLNSTIAFWTPLVSLGQYNNFLIRNRNSPDFSRFWIGLIPILLIGSLASKIYLSKSLGLNSWVILVALLSTFINMLRNTHLTLERKYKSMLLYETIIWLPSIVLLLSMMATDISQFIYLRVFSLMLANVIFVMGVIKNNKLDFTFSFKEFMDGIKFIPSKLLASSLDYLSYEFTGRSSQTLQDKFFKIRKISGVFIAGLELKNQVLLKRAYNVRPVALVISSWSRLDIIFLVLLIPISLCSLELAILILAFIILDFCIGLNYINFIEKRFIRLYMINGSSVLLFFAFLNLGLFNIFTAVLIYSIFKLIISFYYALFRKLE